MGVCVPEAVGDVLVGMDGISKDFPGVQALRSCRFELRRGEIHALVGENGAGKSTLMKILAGVYHRDAGRIRLNGADVDIPTPRAAQQLGISIIHQELSLMPHLTAAQNIFIGREPRARIPFVIDQRRLNEDARTLFQSLNLKVDPQAKVGKLTVAQQQMVEIAKALSYKAEVVIMDEPTATLTDTEIDELFRIIRQLRENGVGVVHISHRLEELKRISDRVTVMRDGQYIATVETKDASIERIITMMVGRTISEDRKRYGLAIGMDVETNIVLATLRRFADAIGRVDFRRTRATAEQRVHRLDIKTPSIHQKVRNLSGGNQQKVVIAKWLTADTEILIFDEPTRGIDVGAKSEIYHLLNELARQGKAIIMISSELPEILRMSHRIVVMCEGRIRGELSGAEATQEKIMTFATMRTTAIGPQTAA